tara:strand:- start:191 stop:1075 length:885 start_codon:yes stop_codon:yes gene_type:complete
MIIHYKEINEILLGNKNPLKYSSEFEFVPLRFYHNNQFRNCIFQTPKLFLPYGKQRLDNGKYIIDLSFQNKDNDLDNKIFLKILKKIFYTIKEKYKDYNVNSFLKKTNFDYTMRLKVSLDSKFYDTSKKQLYKIDPFSYGIFIIGLEGLWIHNNEIWFQWYLLQGKIERPSFLKEYAFIEDKEDKEDKEEKEDKYEKMKSMGVPLGAIEIQKNLDNNLNNNLNKNLTPPPPPPLPNFKRSLPISKIKASDLQSVVLKKSKKIERKKIYSKTGFEPPSIEELQTTLSKLKKIFKN